jgi:acyl carrier protein
MPEATIDEVTTFLRERISARTKVPAGEITETTNLVDIGLESVDAVLICGEIEDSYQVEMEPSLMFEYQTLGEVATAVMGTLNAA